MTAVSIHAYSYIADRYALLPHGASMGEGYGPRVVAGDPLQPADLRGRRIAIPKLRTLAPGFHPYADKTKVPIEPPTGLALRLRRLHLDELPQLFLVLWGRMSMVGPRPEMAWLHEQMPQDFAEVRMSFGEASRTGDMVLEAQELAKGFGDERLFDDDGEARSGQALTQRSTASARGVTEMLTPHPAVSGATVSAMPKPNQRCSRTRILRMLFPKA